MKQRLLKLKREFLQILKQAWINQTIDFNILERGGLENNVFSGKIQERVSTNDS